MLVDSRSVYSSRAGAFCCIAFCASRAMSSRLVSRRLTFGSSVEVRYQPFWFCSTLVTLASIDGLIVVLSPVEEVEGADAEQGADPAQVLTRPGHRPSCFPVAVGGHADLGHVRHVLLAQRLLQPKTAYSWCESAVMTLLGWGNSRQSQPRYFPRSKLKSHYGYS